MPIKRISNKQHTTNGQLRSVRIGRENHAKSIFGTFCIFYLVLKFMNDVVTAAGIEKDTQKYRFIWVVYLYTGIPT